MTKLILLGVFTFSIFIHHQAMAQEDPLRQTQALLLDRKAREGIIANDKKAFEADSFASQTVNGNAEDKQKLYEISAQAMGHLVNKYNGDVNQMQKAMEQALKDPEKFRNSLPPEMIKQIQELARKVEGQKSPKP